MLRNERRRRHSSNKKIGLSKDLTKIEGEEELRMKKLKARSVIEFLVGDATKKRERKEKTVAAAVGGSH